MTGGTVTQPVYNMLDTPYRSVSISSLEYVYCVSDQSRAAERPQESSRPKRRGVVRHRFAFVTSTHSPRHLKAN